MKKLTISIIFALLLVASVFAQSVPQGMKYQAVARDLSGDIMANQQVFLQVQLQSNIKSQQVYYSENHIVTTNQFGLFSLVIGEGVSNKGDFTKIPWSSDDIWMGVAIKVGKKNNYATISNSKLLAVPYAFHAASASKLTDKKGNNGIGIGVPSQVWSLKGNRKTDPETDKLGTTDETDLSIVTNNIERIEITNDSIKFHLPTKFLEPSTFTDLFVERNTYLNTKRGEGGETFNFGDFTVENQSSTLLTGSLNVGTTDANSITKLNGQVTIFADDLDGEQENPDAYPLRVSGSNQGIAISVTRENPGMGSNFVTFFNSENKAIGRIEGGTGPLKEFLLDIIGQLLEGPDEDGTWGITLDGQYYDYLQPEALTDLCGKYFKSNFATEFIKLTLDVITKKIMLITQTIPAIFTVCIEDCDDPFAEIEDLINALLKRRLHVAKYVRQQAFSGGVSFESGGADYAEWLIKADPNEIISFGEVVGVKGGLISKTFSDADQFMAITSNPLIVGAMPEKGYENNYEKVALMGQVPILVLGEANIGDYILPSGNGDGTGIAVVPREMKANDFTKIIGVAWSNSDRKKMINYINTAVGFNSNQMGLMINNMQEVINTMQNEIAKLNPEYKPVYFVTSKYNEDYSNEAIKVSSIIQKELKEILKALDGNSISQKNIDEFLVNNKELVKDLAAMDECGCGDSWNEGILRCWITCVVRRVSQFDYDSIDLNSNVVMELLKKTAWISNKVKNKLLPITTRLKTFLENESIIDLLNDDPEIAEIIESIKNGDIFNITRSGIGGPSSGPLTLENLDNIFNKSMDVLEKINKILKCVGV